MVDLPRFLYKIDQRDEIIDPIREVVIHAVKGNHLQMIASKRVHRGEILIKVLVIPAVYKYFPPRRTPYFIFLLPTVALNVLS
jgi:hypothetical protein